MTENTEPKKVFVGYEDIGGVRVKKWKYVNCHIPEGDMAVS